MHYTNNSRKYETINGLLVFPKPFPIFSYAINGVIDYCPNLICFVQHLFSIIDAGISKNDDGGGVEGDGVDWSAFNNILK
ncbi:MAG: hypothetical protein H0U27_14780 [Nitrosopumilus sp.]|nr:hypothetical protein [Nitrosopumilus sp.]